MATGGEPPNSLEDIVECDICTEIMVQPQALNCLHHFCKPCMVKLQRVQENGITGVSCPNCRKFTAEGNIQNSFILNNLLEIFNKKQCLLEQTSSNDAKCCMQCNRPEVTSLCTDCLIELCDACKGGHLRITLCENHKVINIDDKEQLGKININMYCPKHPSQLMKYNCIPCNRVVCPECKIHEHDIHKTESIEEALKKMLSQTKVHINVISERRNQVKERLNHVNSLKEQCQKSCDSIKQKVLTHTKIVIAKVQADSQEILDQIDAQKSAKIKEFELIKSDLENQLASEESLISWGNAIVNVTKGPAVLSELQGGLFYQIEACAKQQDLPHEPAVEMPVIDFTPNNTSITATNSIGRLDTQSMRAPMQLNIRQMTPERLKQHSNPIGGDRTSETMYKMTSFRSTNVNLKALATNSFLKVRDIKLKRKYRRICYHDSNFWCPCPKPQDNCIEVYDTKGVLLKTIQSKQVNKPRSLHSLTDQTMVLAAQSGLFVINIEGQVETQLIQGSFRDIHVNVDMIVALEKMAKHKDKVHLLKDTNLPTPHSSFLLDNEYSGRVLSTNQSVFVTCHEPKKQSYILQYSMNGEKLCQYGDFGIGEAPGELDIPLLCTVDVRGSLLIADSNNKRLQLLDSRGQWSVIKKWKDKWPWDVVIIDDRHIWVLFQTCDDRTFYIEQYKL